MTTKKMKKFNRTNIFKVKNFEIGKPGTVFIIAEIGVNHNGSYKLAKKMIKVLKELEVDAVKFQLFKSDLF